MNRAYAVLPWGLIILGVLHTAATWRFYDSLSQNALWFFNGGIVMAFTGALNLVHRADGVRAPSLRWLTRGVNIVVLLFSLVSGIVSGAGAAELAVVIGLIGGITLLSFMQPARANSPEPA